jgi:[acyl-carrier-protein] S-malonyltransferase
VQLSVSVPSHCVLMKPAAEAFAGHLREIAITRPAIPVLQNVDFQAHAEPDVIRDTLARQLYSPVQWVRTIEAMRERGITRLIEAGPGKVLAGLVRRIDRKLAAQPVFDSESLAAALNTE